MGVVADAALAAGGEVVGFIPEALTGREVEQMADRSVGFVALPGGFGTLDEILEILTWNQIGIIAKPVAFLDVDRYYESLFRFFDDAVAGGLIRDEHRAMAQRATTVDAAVEIATGPAPSSPSKWTDPTVR